MTEWILIVLLLSPSGIVTSFQHTFDTEAACLRAQVKVENTWNTREYLDAWCQQGSVRQPGEEVT